MDETFLRITPQLLIPISEITFRTSRSGGPGGQHVNKVETKVEMLFDVPRSPSLTNQQRSIILERLKSRISSDGLLRVASQRSRSQSQNKELVLERFAGLLRHALTPRKMRIRTKPGAGARERRLEGKRRTGEKKRLRKPYSE